jgi:F-type H+-transporting ATPase subunit a
MDSFNVHNELSLAPLGYTHPFLTLNVNTILNTWVVLGIIVLLGSYARSVIFSQKKTPLTFYTLLTSGEFFIDLCQQALGYVSYIHCMFITTLFIFILLCNIVAIVPWLEEPTVDFNTTLALGIISFLYVQFSTLYRHGIAHYISSFFQPFFFMLPLNIISKLTSVVSMSLRLFGNIFSGAIISGLLLMLMKQSLWYEVIGIVPNLGVVLFFILFEGYLQAYIFTILTLNFLSMAIKDEGH